MYFLFASMPELRSCVGKFLIPLEDYCSNWKDVFPLYWNILVSSVKTGMFQWNDIRGVCRDLRVLDTY